MASRSDFPLGLVNGSLPPSERPVLSRSLLADASWKPAVSLMRPRADMLSLPERAVQFGTGAFLRGFVEYFIDEANTRQLFNGRVVLVGSTGSGRDHAFAAQDGLFTLQSAGSREEQNELRVIASVSRALNASSQWAEVLNVARQPEIAIVFSNTTEAGFALDTQDDSVQSVPRSYPAKLTAFLYARAKAFGYSKDRGVVVLPCELLDNNGDSLRQLVHTVAIRWQLEPAFTNWLDTAVRFCNTLVDRIVPGAPPTGSRLMLENALGFRDDLVTVAEPYRLFVIEGDESVRARLSFADADSGIVVTDNVRVYRERKLRLLNGTHTALAAAGLLAGIDTVYAAMRDETVSAFAHQLLLGAIAPKVIAPDARTFGLEVLQRFANPHVHHRLSDIANQGTLKLRVRLLPVLQRYAAAAQAIPHTLIAAMAAQLVLLHPQSVELMASRGQTLPTDELGVLVRKHWDIAPQALDGVARILADVSIWNEDLSRVAGLASRVGEAAAVMLVDGVRVALSTDAGASRNSAMVAR